MEAAVLVSFIMPAKNAADYLEEAIKGVLNQSVSCWELIIVEDHSSDDTYQIAVAAARHDKRIRVYKNVGNGKVIGLNYGYSKAQGTIIKCIDADDVVHEKLTEIIMGNTSDAFCHSAYLTDARLNTFSVHQMSKKVLDKDFNYCFQRLIALPRWTWSFNRNLGDIIFPMPDDLPYEDLWFSMVIKKHAKNIVNTRKPLYYYRQHENQTYGGIMNYQEQKNRFRAMRKLEAVKVLEKNYHYFYNSKDELTGSLRIIKKYMELLSESDVSVREILFNNLPFGLAARLLVLKRTPFIIPLIQKMVLQKSRF